MSIFKFMINPYHVYVCYGNVIKTYAVVGRSLYRGYVCCSPIAGQNNIPQHIREELVHYTIGSALNRCREYHNSIIEESKKSIKQLVEYIKDWDNSGMAGADLRRYIHEISIRKRILERVCEENYVSGEPF